MPTKMNMEGGVLYSAPSSNFTEPICFLGTVEMGELIMELDEEEANKRDREEFFQLRKDLEMTFTIDITSNRAWRRIRRIMRKAKQKAKRQWEKRKKCLSNQL